MSLIFAPGVPRRAHRSEKPKNSRLRAARTPAACRQDPAYQVRIRNLHLGYAHEDDAELTGKIRKEARALLEQNKEDVATGRYTGEEAADQAVGNIRRTFDQSKAKAVAPAQALAKKGINPQNIQAVADAAKKGDRDAIALVRAMQELQTTLGEGTAKYLTPSSRQNELARRRAAEAPTADLRRRSQASRARVLRATIRRRTLSEILQEERVGPPPKDLPSLDREIASNQAIIDKTDHVQSSISAKERPTSWADIDVSAAPEESMPPAQPPVRDIITGEMMWESLGSARPSPARLARASSPACQPGSLPSSRTPSRTSRR